MSYQAQNKLMRYQSDYQAVYNQSMLLSQQIQPLQAQLSSLQQYLAQNPDDRNAKANYNKSLQRLNSLNNQIRRNDMRLSTLTRQITVEQQRINQRQAKAMMSAQKKMMTKGYY
jgi:predicted  nucleic acid-binding Zn-ribbon protein